jgi:transcriptional regulator with XRE-family HTH domain
MDQLISAWVKRIRESRNLTQLQLGQILGLGQSSIADIEAAHRSLKLSEHLIIVHKLGVDPVERFPLMGRYYYPEWSKEEFLKQGIHSEHISAKYDQLLVQQYYVLFRAYVHERMKNSGEGGISDVESMYLLL